MCVKIGSMESNSPKLLHDETSAARGIDPQGTLALPMKISETFVSRQGEGKLTGTDSFFLRISGCNLRCHYCDTPYASWHPSGQQQTIGALIDQITESGLDHVVLTGGEPMLPAAIEPLCQELKSRGFHLTMETAGTIFRRLPCDLMSISPKLSTSGPDATQHKRWSELHEQRRLPIETMKRLAKQADDYQFKFVVSKHQEFQEIDAIVSELEIPQDRVWLMPEGVTAAEMIAGKKWIAPHCDAKGYLFCDRMQIHWFGNRRGT